MTANLSPSIMKQDVHIAAQPLSIGEGCLLWQFGNGDEISSEVNAVVLKHYRILKKITAEIPAVFDIVPAYNSLAVHFDPLDIDHNDLKEIFSGINKDNLQEVATARYQLPTIYNGEDLDKVAIHSGLSVDEVVKLHSQAEYTVAMIGFTPHFPYLIGLDSRLETPRLKTPRTRIPAGSVGIGGAQTGVYPTESPGGWNLIGWTDPEILHKLRPGDIVSFIERKP